MIRISSVSKQAFYIFKTVNKFLKTKVSIFKQQIFKVIFNKLIFHVYYFNRPNIPTNKLMIGVF